MTKGSLSQECMIALTFNINQGNPPCSQNNGEESYDYLN